MKLMNHVLVVDDDRGLVELITKYLETEGFIVSAAFDQDTGLRLALDIEPELIILDIMLPRGSGLDLLRKVRKLSQVPVLLLTARGDTVDRVVGLEAGADDYLPKPFDPRELVARIRAILRRSCVSESEEDELSVGDVRLLLSARTVTRGGRTISLTGVEFELLTVLIKNAGKIVSRETLAQAALGRQLHPFDRSIDVHVSKLRRKLFGDEGTDAQIKSMRGSGYILVKSTDRSTA
jgi:two-component system, OmpR family, response regulator